MSEEKNIIIYNSPDGKAKVSLYAKDGTVWMNQNQLAELFDTSKQNIGQHISNILREKELAENSVVKNFFTTASDGKQYDVTFYSLEMILAIGFRVRSKRGTQFRIWANQNLKEYMIKGFVMDDDRLKNPDGRPDYFDELLERIRDIRASEKRFYQKVRDLFALCSDYDPTDKATQMFFAETQNKLIYAVTGKTAAELIVSRADAEKPNMSLSSWKGSVVRKQDIFTAKNYLSESEIDTLNRLVVIFLETAELRAKNRDVVTISFWKENVDRLLEFNDKKVLVDRGTISNEDMEKKVREIYSVFDKKRKEFEAQQEDIKELEELKDNIEKTEIIMQNIIQVTYGQTGQSTKTNKMGMRDMQVRAYEFRDAQYLLLKAPPASGKSRALMFLALDKLKKQGIKKVIVAVPERSIGGSFSKTDLKSHGFFADWAPNDYYNLCTPGSDNSKSKVESFHNFMQNEEEILICTHATLRFACEELDEQIFNNTLLAIDEFHHASADINNRLGELLRLIMKKSTAHVIAMTGSYFRGDSVPILLPEDEIKFTKVTYNYYEQLNGYTYLKSLGIGYHFYQGKYTEAILEVLDTDKKTILHIPNVNSGESTKDKMTEVGFIIDAIGDVEKQDSETGILYVKRHPDKKVIKIADLVDDSNKIMRDKTLNYLRNIKSIDDMDLIIALGMAKEGFDWPYCEHALTVGYRGSLTEIIQIIGRTTRDSSNKTHAQFTNLIAQPDAADNEVKLAVNNMLKAITASLLMEQVLAPNWKFKTKLFEDDKPLPGEIKIFGLKEPSSKRVKDILESDLDDLKATILQHDDMQKAMPDKSIDPEVINKVLIPKIIKIRYPSLSEVEVEEIRQHVIVDSVIKKSEIKETEDKRFIRLADTFINIDDLHIDLIDKINPFQKAFEILSKSVTTKVLKIIQDTIEATRIKMDFEEAKILWPKIIEFKERYSREPNINSFDPLEKRMAECIIYLKAEKRKRDEING